MHIGIPKEIKDGEYRVGITPDGVASLTSAGHQVSVQHHAGARIGMSDAAYRSAGAMLVTTLEQIYEADLIVKVKELQAAEYPLLKPGQIVFAYLHAAPDPALAAEMLARDIIGIAYETVTDAEGSLPLLKPMSMIAGRLAIQVGAWGLQLPNGGKGTLLSGGPGLPRGRVLILGAGNAGSNATHVAASLGADVTVLDVETTRLAALKHLHGERIKIAAATHDEITTTIRECDLIIGAILKPGNLAPKLLSRAMLRSMQPGSVLVDICIDQGGLSETSRPSSHSEPFYIDEGIVHYCVGNMPSAVARSATLALCQATLPFVKRLAQQGLANTCSADVGFALGVQFYRGHVTHPNIARDLKLPHTPLDRLLANSNP
jgi:alanine dehydrogenase